MTTPITTGLTRVGSGRLRVTVDNLWLLYLYASRLYGLLSQDERVKAEGAPQTLPQLVARVLCREVNAKLRQGLTPHYQERREVLSAVRGRIDHLATARGNLLAKGVVSCSFAELTTDTPRNRYILAALRAGHHHLAHNGSDTAAADECRSTAAELLRLGVQAGAPDHQTPAAETFGRMDRDDRRMVAAAKMLLDMTTPSFALGDAWVRQLDTAEDSRLRALFEEAVRGFYTVNLPAGWTVGKRKLSWPAAPDGNAIWPRMETDITIVDPNGRQLVIDTKFTSALTEPRDGRPSTLKSGHLYQIFTYLYSQDTDGSEAARTATGLLLYPSTDPAPDVRTRRSMGSHQVAVETVDLATPPAEVGRQLRRILSEFMDLPEGWGSVSQG